MSNLKRIKGYVLDLIEIIIPAIMLLSLFVVFIWGIFCRYVLKNPQTWTYELGSICFLSFVVLSMCYVQRVEKQIVFDMLYNRMSDNTKRMMNIMSNLIVAVTCAFLIPTTFRFLSSMRNLTSQVLKIPRALIFVCFLVLFISTFFRAGYRAITEIKHIISSSFKYIEERR